MAYACPSGHAVVSGRWEREAVALAGNQLERWRYKRAAGGAVAPCAIGSIGVDPLADIESVLRSVSGEIFGEAILDMSYTEVPPQRSPNLWNIFLGFPSSMMRSRFIC